MLSMSVNEIVISVIKYNKFLKYILSVLNRKKYENKKHPFIDYYFSIPFPSIYNIFFLIVIIITIYDVPKC